MISAPNHAIAEEELLQGQSQGRDASMTDGCSQHVPKANNGLFIKTFIALQHLYKHPDTLLVDVFFFW